MAYFTGAPDGSGIAHDDQAKKIAQNAYAFTQKRMRWVDMQSYTLLLALEVSPPRRFMRGAADVSKLIITAGSRNDASSGTGC